MVKKLSISQSCDLLLDQELLADQMRSEMSSHCRTLSRGGCDPMYASGPCGAGSLCFLNSSLSLPHPPNSSVSPGWEVMELIRPVRG